MNIDESNVESSYQLMLKKSDSVDPNHGGGYDKYNSVENLKWTDIDVSPNFQGVTLIKK